MISTKVYNKQWKRVVVITHVDSYGFAVDTLGIQHNIKALREVRPHDKQQEQIGWI